MCVCVGVCVCVCVCPDFTLTRVKISLDKGTQKICKAFYTTIHVSTECILTFVINFLFLKILAFFAKKRQSKATFYHD